MPISSNLGYSAIAKPGVCTSSTRPASPYEGQYIYETDTDKTWFWNGSAWIQTTTYDGDGRLYTPASMMAITEAGAGRGIGIRASSGDTTAPILQFTNNAVSVQYASITATSNGALNMNSNYVLTPNQPAFLVYTGGWNKAVAWEDLANFGGTAVVGYNVGSNWNSSTGLFTAPVSGYYLFYAGGWANYNGAGNRYAVSFQVNTTVGGDWLYISGANTSAVDTPLAMSPVVRYVQAGWYVRTTMFSAVAMQLGTSSHKFYYGGYLLG